MTTSKWLLLAAAIVMLDQASKLVAVRLLDYGVPLPLFPGFNFTLLHNTGAAFSVLAGASGWQRWLFCALAVIVSVVIVHMLRAAGPRARWLPGGLTLLLGGALGNLWDRLTLGYVIDFIQLYYDRWYWPAFNVADSAISIGAVMLILHGTAFGRRRDADAKSDGRCV